MKLPALTIQTNQLLKLFQKYSPSALSLVFLLLASYVLAQISWQLFEPMPVISSVDKPGVQQQPAKNTNQAFQQKLIQLNNTHLFGQSNAPANKLASKDAPETSLNLVLRGIFAIEPMRFAMAIISAGKNAKELTYGVGDSVPGNATIEEIYASHVILMRNGRLETLKLPEKSIGGVTKSSATSGGLNMNQGSDKILGDIRRDIMKNPTSFGQYAIPIPVSKNGKLQGYRLRPQKKGKELFKQFGLKRNDVVTQINGIKLNDPVQGIAALKKLSSTSNVNLTVLRNGVETPLQFSIR